MRRRSFLKLLAAAPLAAQAITAAASRAPVAVEQAEPEVEQAESAAAPLVSNVEIAYRDAGRVFPGTRLGIPIPYGEDVVSRAQFNSVFEQVDEAYGQLSPGAQAELRAITDRILADAQLWRARYSIENARVFPTW